MDLRDYLREQLSVPTIAALGAPLGLRATQSARIADEVLPGQLGALEKLAHTPEGAQKLLDLTRDRIPAGTVGSLTGSPEALTRLEHSGAGLLPEVMGNDVNTEVQRLAASTGTDAITVRRMMERLLPLLLSLVGQRATSGKLTAVTLGTLFGAAALVGAAAVPVAVVSATPDVIIERVAPIPAAPEPVIRPAQPPQDDRRRRTPVWWWLLPLALLLGLGGCYLSQRNQAALTLTRPTEGETVTGPLQMSGTGKAGETVTVSENGTALSTARVGQDGTFSATVPARAAGPHTYAVSESGAATTLSRKVTAQASAATVETPSAETPKSETPSGAAASTGSSDLAFNAPASGSSVPAGALTLSGTGPADTDLSISEDGNALGNARTDASGAWTFAVPGPTAGAHTYAAAAGAVTSDLKLTVAAGTAQAGSCTRAFLLSLKDGAQVKQPFRFGGEGSGQSYVVTVSRGTRQIGQKVLPLDASCSYSYTSKPSAGRITYALKESGQGAAASTITLKSLVRAAHSRATSNSESRPVSYRAQFTASFN